MHSQRQLHRPTSHSIQICHTTCTPLLASTCRLRPAGRTQDGNMPGCGWAVGWFWKPAGYICYRFARCSVARSSRSPKTLPAASHPPVMVPGRTKTWLCHASARREPAPPPLHRCWPMRDGGRPPDMRARDPRLFSFLSAPPVGVPGGWEPTVGEHEGHTTCLLRATAAERARHAQVGRGVPASILAILGLEELPGLVPA
jgi:hypothetical protein